MRIVLVVDDEHMLRMLATEMLEDAGHAVVAFDTAAQAIAYCGSTKVLDARSAVNLSKALP